MSFLKKSINPNGVYLGFIIAKHGERLENYKKREND